MLTSMISVYKQNESAVVAVADSGVRILEDMDIFSPFVTENTMRVTGQGTGWPSLKEY